MRTLALATWLATACPLPAAAQVKPDAGARADGGAGAAPCIDPALLSAAAEADARLRETGDCNDEDVGRLAAAVRMLDRCAPAAGKPPDQWVFPVANISFSRSIGGRNGEGFVKNRNIRCYATPWAGHPAHDLFVNDRRQSGRDAQGNPFPAVAAEAGFVLVARDGWQKGDEAKGGNYVMLYLPASRKIAYYAHLESVAVKAGQRVEAGEVLGLVGRTGKNAFPRRSQTHLHFGLWEADTFRPVNSFSRLKAARSVRVVVPPAPAPVPAAGPPQ